MTHARSARLSVLAMLACVAAAILASPPAPADDGFRRQTIVDAAADRSVTIDVALPDSYALQDARPYPVLYVLDGETNGAAARAVAAELAATGRIPETIVVAVHAGATRAFDDLPAGEATQPHGGGGATAYLDFFETTLIPHVERHWRAGPLRILSGHSYGGVFATYALVERPGLFHAALAQSPYVDPGIAADLVARVERNAGRLAGFHHACLGDEPQLEPGFASLAAAFDAASAKGGAGSAGATPGLTAATDRLAGESHMSTRLLGLYRGLERVFAPRWPADEAALADEGVEALRRRIAALERAYGYPMLPAAATFQQATQRALSQGDLESARAAAALYVEHYPRAVTAHFLSAVAAASAGDRERAAEAIGTALALFEADPRPRLRGLEPTLRGLARKLAPEAPAAGT